MALVTQKVIVTSCDEGEVALARFALPHVSQRYVDWLNDPEVMRFTRVEKRHTLATARAYVRAANADKNCHLFRILLDEFHIGNIRLSNLDEVNRRAEVAIIVGEKRLWGRGVAPVAIDLVTRIAFEKLGLHKLIAIVLEPNQPSQRAFSKAGFAVEGILRSHYRMEGRYVDAIFMTRFADPPVKA